MVNSRWGEDSEVLNHIPPASRSANTYKGAVGVNAADCMGVLFTIQCGDGTNTSTLNVKIQESDTDVDGNYVDIPGAAIAQLTFDAADNKIAYIDVKTGGRAAGTRKKYLRAVAVVATAATIFGVTAQRYGLKNVPFTNSPAAVLV